MSAAVVICQKPGEQHRVKIFLTLIQYAGNFSMIFVRQVRYIEVAELFINNFLHYVGIH